VIACLWFWPLLKGDQLGQSYELNRIAPWAGVAQTQSLPVRFPFFDSAIAFQPWADVARDQLGDGHLPLWNPYEWGGTTLAGNMQSALLFPLTWLILAFPFAYGWGALAVAKVLLAGLGAYALAREVRTGRDGALVAGTVYMLSGPMMMWVQWPLGSVFAMFPWLLLATTRLVRKTTPGSVAGVALALALTVLAGHPESAIIATSAAAIYMATLVVFEREARPWPRTAALWAGGLVLGAAIAGLVVIPFLQALGPSVTRSARTSLIPTRAPSVWSVLQFAMPGLFGDAEPDFYGWPFGYFGLPALVLASVALVRFRAEPVARALAATVAVVLLVVYRVPPLSWFVEHVPPWSTSYLGEQRTYFVLALAGAVGAGAAFSSLARRPLPFRGVAAIVAAGALLIAAAFLLADHWNVLKAPASVKHHSVWLTALLLLGAALLMAAIGRLGSRLALVLAIGLCAASVAGFQDLNVILSPDRAHPAKPPAVAALQARPQPFRIGVIRRGRELTLLANTAALYGLEDIEGYDFPLSKRWSDFQTTVLRFGGSQFPELRSARHPPTGAGLAGLRMMNVRYYLAAPGATRPAAGFETVYRGRDAVVFRDRHALPRAYLVPRTVPASDDQALAALAAGRLDPRRLALVPPRARAPAAGGGRLRPARVERLAPDHVRVQLPPGGAGWLVLASAYSPDWKAEVDGAEVEPRPTDFAAMGVPVAASARTVDFRLDRGGYWLGAAISLAALLVTGLLAASGRRRRVRS